MSEQGKTAVDRFPAQIKYIVGNEACERFSYYGIRGILALYISEILFHNLPVNMANDRATEIIHLFIFANYFTPLFGAWLSDRLWGRYNTILYVSLVYCLGNLVLAMGVGTFWGLAAGLGLIAIGSGGIKPCVSAFCGDQFRPEQSPLLQKAYGLFYWSINFGSFFSFLVIPWVKDHMNYRWAFGIPGFLMFTATLIFWLGRKKYSRVLPSRETKSAGFIPVLWHALTVPSQELSPECQQVVRGPARLLTLSGAFGLALGGVAFLGLFLVPWPDLKAFGLALGVLVVALVLHWLVLKVGLRLKRLQGLQFVRTGSGIAILWGFASIGVAGVAAWTFAHQLTKVHGLPAVKLFGEASLTGILLFVMLVFALPVLAFVGGTAVVGSLGTFWATTRREVVDQARQLAGGVRSFWDDARGYFTPREVDAARSVGPLLGVFAPITIFWTLFDQTSSTWVLQGHQMTPVSLFGFFTIGAEQMQSMNPALVMILVPLLTLVVYPAIERRGIRVSALRRMSVGMLVAASSYVVVGFFQERLAAGAHLSVLWQTVPYFILTTAEVLVSTTGLEFAFTQAAPEMKSIIMSLWLLTVAVGDLYVPLITQLRESILGEHAGAGAVSAAAFHFYAGLTFVVGILFIIVASRYKEREFESAQAIHPQEETE